jgi:uncharacterized membrane protein YdjX (TVP38/TMEM64 family)
MKRKSVKNEQEEVILNHQETKPHNKHFLAFTVIIIFIILLVLIYLSPLKDFFTDPKAIREFLLGFGLLAPLVYIFLQFMQVILSAIPGQVLSIAGGYLFGFTLGTAYNLIGTMAGSLVVFALAKKFGRKFVESFVPKKDMHHLDRFFKRQGVMPLIIARVIPFFPNDAVSFFLGITKISYWRYTWTTFLGFLPQFLLLNFLGIELLSGINFLTISLVIFLSLFGIFYIFRHKLKILLLKEIREVEKEVQEAEDFVEKI